MIGDMYLGDICITVYTYIIHIYNIYIYNVYNIYSICIYLLLQDAIKSIRYDIYVLYKWTKSKYMHIHVSCSRQCLPCMQHCTNACSTSSTQRAVLADPVSSNNQRVCKKSAIKSSGQPTVHAWLFWHNGDGIPNRMRGKLWKNIAITFYELVYLLICPC